MQDKHILLTQSTSVLIFVILCGNVYEFTMLQSNKLQGEDIHVVNVFAWHCATLGVIIDLICE